MMWELVDRFELVTDEEIDAAIGLLAREAKLVAEGAGAASLAAALKIRESLAGKKVVGILSGGNAPRRSLGADFAKWLNNPSAKRADAGVPPRAPMPSWARTWNR